MTLRVRLVVVLVALVAAGLFGTWLIGSKVMENYLLGQLDARLDRAVSTPRTFPLRDNMLLRDAQGVVAGTPFEGLPAYGTLTAGEHVTVGTHRVVMRKFDDVELVAVADQSEVDRAVGDLRVAFLLISLGALILVGMAGYALVRASTRALEEVEQVAGEIAAGDLSRRVPVRRPGSEVGRLASALNTMLGQIEQAFAVRVSSENRMRQFVADASHELRTPLTSIRGYAELYRQGAAPDAGEVLRRIEDQAARMGVLVEDLLQLARLDSEQPLTLSTVDLVVLVTDAVHEARVRDPQRSVSLDLPGVPVLVDGDDARVRQVLTNLLDNALTHTPAGSPIEVRLTPDVIEVADHGPGMEPEQAARVFERFYRVDPARGPGGAGLGLAIVAALVAAHGWRVEVDTAPGEGAVFRVLFGVSERP
ncbi:sensor histidine kinase [Lentzea flava]|uniref:histidine kinase n=1 Tax=Lentzea flava TaxID=103732 RepID=A0ABQ2UYN0_9PSEU|nr:HAMP domain-containing sensor histidine kinase [Lentzea flava]MCP2202236.1 two-component system, OmpR family, sensor kinase [Lentzea flava]GGU58098.1 two-component sensor histidine kinase [Lentzea flava]